MVTGHCSGILRIRILDTASAGHGDCHWNFCLIVAILRHTTKHSYVFAERIDHTGHRFLMLFDMPTLILSMYLFAFFFIVILRNRHPILIPLKVCLLSTVLLQTLCSIPKALWKNSTIFGVAMHPTNRTKLDLRITRYYCLILTVLLITKNTVEAYPRGAEH